MIESTTFRLILSPLLMMGLAACNEGEPIGPDPCLGANPPVSCNGPIGNEYAFVYEPPAGAPAITSMILRGSFNNWGNPPGVDVVMEQRQDGTWAGFVELDSTETYQYKFVINGEWIVNMCADGTWGHQDHGGLVHLEADDCVSDGHGGMNAVINLSQEPGLSFTHVAGNATWVSIANDVLSVRFSARAGAVTAARVVADGADTIDAYVQFRRGLTDVWRAPLPGATSSYTILVQTMSGSEAFGPYDVPANPFRSVSWAGSAVAYQIFPERFWNGDPSNDSLTLATDEYEHNYWWQQDANALRPTLESDWYAAPNDQHCCHQYYGGDLQGILDRRQHLLDLGVNVVYLNPIWHSGSAHGYDQFDYTMLAPEYGDSALLRQFVDQMHADGIRIIWDFVPNHSGIGFAPFLDAVENGEASPYWDWYNFHPNENGLQAGDGNDYDAWFGFGSLPKLNTAHPDVFSYLIDSVAVRWTEYGFDGIRVDVPNELSNRGAFFSTFRSKTKAVDPDVYLIGEIWQRDPSWLRGDQFDALMNYAVGRDVVGNFALGNMNAASAWNEMVEMYATYPEAVTAMNFNLISSHDTNRLLTFMGGGGTITANPSGTALARQKLAAALLYALPGMPVTYYGDECAMTGSNDGSIHRSRRTMDWDGRCVTPPGDMLDFYVRLGEEKRTLPALASSVIRAHSASGAVLSFYRGEPGPGELLAVFNQGASDVDFTLPAGTWVDALIPGDQVSGSVIIPARGWRYLVRN